MITESLIFHPNLPLTSIASNFGEFSSLILPISEGDYSTYLFAEEGCIRVEPRSYLEVNKGGRIPLFAISLSESPHELCPLAFRAAHELLNSPPALRKDREYPEIFEYLGWCS